MAVGRWYNFFILYIIILIYGHGSDGTIPFQIFLYLLYLFDSLSLSLSLTPRLHIHSSPSHLSFPHLIIINNSFIIIPPRKNILSSLLLSSLGPRTKKIPHGSVANASILFPMRCISFPHPLGTDSLYFISYLTAPSFLLLTHCVFIHY